MTGQINDLWVSYLQGEGYTGSQYNDLMRQALQDQTGTTRKQLNDLWSIYLKGEGHAGSVDDMMYAWLGDKGYAGSLNDRVKQAVADGDIFTDPDPSGVVYPLDAGEAEIAGLGADARAAMSEGDQKGTVTFFDNSGTKYEWGALPDGFTGGTAPVISFTNPTAFELEVGIPDFSGTGSPGVTQSRQSFYMFTPAFFSLFSMDIEVSDEGADVSVTDHQSATAFSETFSAGTTRVGFLFEDGAGYRIWVDDSEVPAITPNNTSVDDCFLGMTFYQEDGIDLDNVGLMASAHLITDPSDFTTTFPAGSYDIDGTQFN